MSATTPDRVPVTILTGFLGSGKTTLLNRILSENHGKRIAVIENEFGEVGIDNDLVVSADEEIFEMNNGCICCTVRGDLIRILGTLMRRRDRFDHVLIETTGLADPAPVVQTFFVDDELKAQFELDAVVTVVDARHVALHLDQSSECQEQIAFADVILLNKAALVSAPELSPLATRDSAMNRWARCHPPVRCELPLDDVLGIRAFDLGHAQEVDPSILSDTAHEHDTSVSSVGLDVPGDVHAGRLEKWIRKLLAERGADIFRMKGVLSVAGSDRQLVFQGVHMLFESSEGRPWGRAPRRSKIVLIGRGLDVAGIDKGFRRCLA